MKGDIPLWIAIPLGTILWLWAFAFLTAASSRFTHRQRTLKPSDRKKDGIRKG